MKWVLLVFTLPALGMVARSQYFNWKNHGRDGNGADKQRIGLALGSIAAIGSCLCCALYLFVIPAVTPGYIWVSAASGFISIVPVVGIILYGLPNGK